MGEPSQRSTAAYADHSNLPPEQMTARHRLCECGHVEACHYPDNTFGIGGRCHATVYTVVDHGPLTSGMNATECKCLKFEVVR